MFTDTFLFLLFLALVSLPAATLIVFTLHRLVAGRPRHWLAAVGEETASVFLFDGNDLVDATAPAHRLLRRRSPQRNDWDTLMSLLVPRFPGLVKQLDDLPQMGEFTVTSDQRDTAIRAEYWDGLIRLSIRDLNRAENPIEYLQLDAMETELDALRSIAEDSPQLIWKQGPANDIVWANRSYLEFSERQSSGGSPTEAIWRPAPPAPGLGDTATETLPEQKRIRMGGDLTGGWFDITTVRRGPETIHFAVDAKNAIDAESARRMIVQTLTKTFANLATGLAIFDRARRLVLFNPALVDLTGLAVDFLSSRPGVHAVLDRLHDLNMLPEPKNYPSWRDRMAALEVEATNGTYCETWSLPSGQTYRVTGRPHPDGAIAFLFEDISDEVSLTRRFRAEIETTQSVLDVIDEGLAVFSAAGTVVLTNRAYNELWDLPGDKGIDARLTDEISRWRKRTAPTPFWTDLQNMTFQTQARDVLTDQVCLDNGRVMVVRLVALPGGSIMIGFGKAVREDGMAIVPDPDDLRHDQVDLRPDNVIRSRLVQGF